MLLENGIALWDVIAQCDIYGSSDASIENVTVNDLSMIFLQSEISAIFLNGGTAYRLFEILKEEFDIIICPNGGDLKDKLFRVGHIGHHTIKDNDILFEALDALVARGVIS